MIVRWTHSSCPTPSAGLVPVVPICPRSVLLLTPQILFNRRRGLKITAESINMSVCLVCVRLFGFLSNPRSVLHLQHFSALSKNQRVSNWQMGLFGFFLSASGTLTHFGRVSCHQSRFAYFKSAPTPPVVALFGEIKSNMLTPESKH